jgi:hypothetical protein
MAKPNLYPINNRAHATILEALRYYQRCTNPGDRQFFDIATDGGTLTPLDDDEIDSLCEELNHDGLNLAESIAHFTGNEAEPRYTLIQQGGSSCELYIHSHETEEEAEQDRIDCARDGAYETSDIVEIPPELAALGEIFYEAAEALLEASTDTMCVDVDPMSGEHCDKCGDELESSQIGLCDDCQEPSHG